MFSSWLMRNIAATYINNAVCRISTSGVLRNLGLNASHKVNNFEKRCLVWTKKYKTVEEVPSHVAPDVMEKARNKVRIRLANIMMALTVLGCFIMIKSGQRLRDGGDSLSKRSMDWHQSLKDDDKAQKQ